MFEVGDIVVGNENASQYAITAPGVRCRVIKNRTLHDLDRFITVELEDKKVTGEWFIVDGNCFDKVEEPAEPDEEFISMMF